MERTEKFSVEAQIGDSFTNGANIRITLPVKVMDSHYSEITSAIASIINLVEAYQKVAVNRKEVSNV